MRGWQDCRGDWEENGGGGEAFWKKGGGGSGAEHLLMSSIRICDVGHVQYCTTLYGTTHASRRNYY